jgi:hypothetical protein
MAEEKLPCHTELSYCNRTQYLLMFLSTAREKLSSAQQELFCHSCRCRRASRSCSSCYTICKRSGVGVGGKQLFMEGGERDSASRRHFTL